MPTRQRKAREPIPSGTAAKVLFAADRTCCVCRKEGKAVQIHHIDDDPANNNSRNLAVLCFECHRETQIRGGFDRKLDADQIVLYRDDWEKLVTLRRARDDVASDAKRLRSEHDLAQAMAIAEIYREAGAYEQLALHYHHLGNDELRDKYIEKAIALKPSDERVVFLRCIQSRAGEIPQDTLTRVLESYTKGEFWSQRAFVLNALGKHVDAAQDLVRTVTRALAESRPFTAALYLKRLYENRFVEELLIAAREKARQAGDLWWEVRALEELGWTDQLDKLIRENAAKIDEMSVDTNSTIASRLKELLAKVRGAPLEIATIRRQRAEAIAKRVMREPN